MPTLHELLPDADVLLALEPEQLAGYVLEHLNALPEQEREHLSRHGFFLQHTVEGYARPRHKEILRALMEAWVWLEREGLLAPKPAEQGEWRFITRRGRRLAGRADVDTYRRSNLLPRAQLHPVIADAVSAEFLAGRYDAAVFNGFREIEIAVRTAGHFTPADYGDALMRAAFHEDTGPLADPAALKSERQALAHLFAGAFGSLRNPLVHRRVGTGPDEVG